MNADRLEKELGPGADVFASMPRYVFHMHFDDATARDPLGIDVPNLKLP